MSVDAGIMCLNIALVHLQIGLSVMKEGKGAIPKAELLNLEISLTDAMEDMKNGIHSTKRYMVKRQIDDVEIHQKLNELIIKYDAFCLEKDEVMSNILGNGFVFTPNYSE